MYYRSESRVLLLNDGKIERSQIATLINVAVRTREESGMIADTAAEERSSNNRTQQQQKNLLRRTFTANSTHALISIDKGYINQCMFDQRHTLLINQDERLFNNSARR